MKTQNPIPWSVLILLLMPVNPSRAADENPVTLTLGGAVQTALQKNASYEAVREREKAARIRSSLSLLPSDPMVMVEKNGQEGNPLRWGSARSEMWMVDQSFRFPGKGLADAAVSRAAARQAGAESDFTRRSIVRETREAWWDFYYRSKMAGILRDTELQWKSMKTLLRSRDLTGQGLTVSALRARLELDRSENDRITAARELEVSRANLNHLFQETGGVVYVLGDEPPARPLSLKREEAVHSAIASSPEMAVLDAALDREKARKRAASLDHLPDFNVRAYGMKEPGASGFDEYGMRVGMTLPVFFPFKQTQAVRAASADSRAAGSDTADARERIAHMAEEAWTQADAAWRDLFLYGGLDIERQVQRAWESSRTAYRNGNMTATQLFQDYRMVLETLEEYYRARADYGKALARLEYLTGETGDITTALSRTDEQKEVSHE